MNRPLWDQIGIETFAILSEKDKLIGYCSEPIDLYWQLARESILYNEMKKRSDSLDVVKLEGVSYAFMQKCFLKDSRNAESGRTMLVGLADEVHIERARDFHNPLDLNELSTALLEFRARLPYFDATVKIEYEPTMLHF